jgi:hypothetical protein
MVMMLQDARTPEETVLRLTPEVPPKSAGDDGWRGWPSVSAVPSASGVVIVPLTALRSLLLLRHLGLVDALVDPALALAVRPLDRS